MSSLSVVAAWLRGCALALACLASAGSADAAALVAHWRFDEAGPPYADGGAHAIALAQDAGTTPAIPALGVAGHAALLHVDQPPAATRLAADHAALQRDSFGFSFWIQPVSVNPYDNLLAKEMAYTNGIPNDERMAWQVRVLNDAGSGAAAVEFLVRGDKRQGINLYGAVTSAAAVPLSAGASAWIHIAGGYHAASGRLSLFVNGVEYAVNGTPGASGSGGSPLAVGTAKNGGDIVAYAASTRIEDLQVYDGPLWSEDVAYLMAQPGEPLPRDFAVVSQSVSAPGGEVTVRFDAVCGAGYRVEAATEPSSFAQVASYESSVNLVHDAGTAGPWTVAGRVGSSVLLRWDSNPGVSTRLYANNPALQTDSFGFSFWMRPSDLHPWDNLLAKEMAFDNGVPDWSRMAWQVHLLDNNGSGFAPLELVVRGAHRAATNFHGLVVSSVTLPLYTDAPEWFHVAGGYDAATGALRLYVNGVESAAAGVPDARNADGSPLAVGTVRNGGDIVQYAATCRMDDLQLYDRPPSAAQAANLRAWPGSTVPHVPRLAARWHLNEPNPPYLDSARGATVGAVQLPAAALEAELGPAALSRAFFRVIEEPNVRGFPSCD